MCVCVNMRVEYIELPAVCVMLCHSLVSRLMGDTRLWQPPPLIFWGQKKKNLMSDLFAIKNQTFIVLEIMLLPV